MILFCWLPLLVEASPAYPLTRSANSRHLVDQSGMPFLLAGDTPQKMVRNCPSNDIVFYVHNRATNGFNALQCMFAFDQWDLYGGNEPAFARYLPGGDYIPDFSSPPNTNFWNYIRWITEVAATNGICMFWCPTETGTQLKTFRANGTNACYQYGRLVGNTLKDKPNVVWMHGNDHQTWTNEADDALLLAVAQGIADTDTNHLQTVILNYHVSMSTDDTRWFPFLGLNCNYDYSPQYANTLRAYNLTNLPVFLGEGHYANESTGGPWFEPTSDLILRHQLYWTMLSGGMGQIYGSYYSWSFDTGWANYLDIPAVRHIQHASGLFTNRAWFKLVPDANHLMLTAGYGTWNTNTLLSENTYATAALTTDGKLGIIYSPSDTGRVLTVNLGAFAGPINARWFDPAGGSYSEVPGSPFNNLGSRNFIRGMNNSGGDDDWVLVLETQPSEPLPPTVTVTAPVNGAMVSGQVLVTASTTDNVGVFGVQFRVDGANLGPELVVPPYTKLWNTLQQSNGLHTVQAIARDAVGLLATNLVSVTVNNGPVSVPTEALVAAYGFDEGFGTTVADASGHGNRGEIQGAIWLPPGKYDHALYFHEASWVTVNDSASLRLTNTMSLTAWVYPTVSSSWSTVLMKEQYAQLAYALYAAGFHGNPPATYVYTSTLLGLGGQHPIPLGVWTHLAATYDGSTLRLFVNGVMAASESASGGLSPLAGPLRIGGNSIWGEHFVGAIDEVRIYNRALSDVQIVADMQTPTALLPDVSLAAPPQSAAQILQSGFRFYLSSTLPVTGWIEYSTNLTSWQPLKSFVCTNSVIEVVDPGAGIASGRFYRARLP